MASRRRPVRPLPTGSLSRLTSRARRAQECQVVRDNVRASAEAVEGLADVSVSEDGIGRVDDVLRAAASLVVLVTDSDVEATLAFDEPCVSSGSWSGSHEAGEKGDEAGCEEHDCCYLDCEGR